MRVLYLSKFQCVHWPRVDYHSERLCCYCCITDRLIPSISSAFTVSYGYPALLLPTLLDCFPCAHFCSTAFLVHAFLEKTKMNFANVHLGKISAYYIFDPWSWWTIYVRTFHFSVAIVSNLWWQYFWSMKPRNNLCTHIAIVLMSVHGSQAHDSCSWKTWVPVVLKCAWFWLMKKLGIPIYFPLGQV